MVTERWWDDALPQCKGRGKEGEVAEEEVLRPRGHKTDGGKYCNLGKEVL